MVLTPRAVLTQVPLLTFPATENSTIIKGLCYYYEYDDRHRMILKQLPGAEAMKMVYDKRERLVLVQDGNQRFDTYGNLKTFGQW